jgi:hypothetical protein
MKKLFILFLSFLLIWSMQVKAQTERNCFNTQFDNDATTLNLRNAYMLGYLSTMAYVDYLRYVYSPVPSQNSSFIKGIRDDNEKFIDEFEKKMFYLFTSSPTFTPSIKRISTTTRTLTEKPTAIAALAEPAVTFDFIHKCNPAGYDPEAILISTPTTIYVIFRGTDRVSCNVSKGGYTWAEWMSSDFKFLKRDASVLNAQVQGQVHRGMVESLLSQAAGDTKNFADELASVISLHLKNKSTGVNKKVWISGHSLGGGHAQLFAMFLKFNYNITAQGLYIYEAPHPGDAKFVTQLNNTIGKNKIQRFEFGDDPIPTLPPQVFLFGRAGVRNYFKDHSSTMQGNTEQIAAIDDLKILCALGNLPGEQIPQFASFEFPPLCPGSACFHHPTFVLEAIRHQLASSTLSTLPPAVPLPLAGDNCNQGDITKADNNDLINNTVTAIENTLAKLVWQAGNILSNLIGGDFPEGKYRLANYAYKNNSKRYMNWNGNNNSQVSLSTSGSIFNITHKLTGGYQLHISNNNLAADVTFNAVGFPTGEERTNNIIMRPKDAVIGDEETWYFFKIQNTNNIYVLLNWNTKKVLDAPNNCLGGGSCGINEFNAGNDDATQVWILEKVN